MLEITVNVLVGRFIKSSDFFIYKIVKVKLNN